MKQSKHKPARPHWERIVSRRSNNVNEVLIPEHSPGYWFSVTTFKRVSQKTNATPGK